jgi:hypothetical protein
VVLAEQHREIELSGAHQTAVAIVGRSGLLGRPGIVEYA